MTFNKKKRVGSLKHASYVVNASPVQEDPRYFEACLSNHLAEEDNDERIKEALNLLDELVQAWVTEDLNIDTNDDEECEVKLYTFGSYRLGVRSPDRDVDALVVGPHHLHRGLFFTSFLAKLQKSPRISKITAVPESYVPVIKCIINGVPFDLVYAQVNLVPNFDIFDDHNLKNIDSKSVLSLNGRRVSEAILQLVPDVGKFRLCLSFIKLWAKERGIYSSHFGYLPGVSWAILIARVCQLYQTVPPLRLIQHFFYFYAYIHRWPQPILLTPPYYIENLRLEVWNPQVNRNHRYDVMPIITPAYPFMNSTYNVSQHTLLVVQQEFERAYGLFCEQHTQVGSVWDKLLEPSEFFQEHTHYLRLSAFGASKENLHTWFGWVRSKIRHLTNLLASPNHSFRFRPYPHCFWHKTEKREFCTSFFIGLVLMGHKTAQTVPMQEISYSVNGFKSRVNSWHKHKEGMDLEAEVISRRDLPEYTRTQPGRPMDAYGDVDIPPRKSQDAQQQHPSSTKQGTKLAPLADEFKTMKVDDSIARPSLNTSSEVQQTANDHVPPTELVQQQNVVSSPKKKNPPVWKVKQDPPHVPCSGGPSCCHCQISVGCHQVSVGCPQVSVGCQIPVSGQGT